MIADGALRNRQLHGDLGIFVAQGHQLEDGDLAEEGTINARERVRLALQALGEATRAEIHEQVTDLSPGTVKKELTRLCGSEVAEWTGEVRERQQVAKLTGTGTSTYKGTGTGSGGDDQGDQQVLERF